MTVGEVCTYLQGRAPLCNCTNLSRCFSADSTLVPKTRTHYDYGTAWLWAAAARKPKPPTM